MGKRGRKRDGKGERERKGQRGGGKGGRKQARARAGDRHRVILVLPDRAALAAFVREHRPDIIGTELVPDAERARRAAYRVSILATKAKIRALDEAGLKPEVHENASALGRARQADVGRGDRFEGGKVVPKGRGRLLGDERPRGER